VSRLSGLKAEPRLLPLCLAEQVPVWPINPLGPRTLANPKPNSDDQERHCQDRRDDDERPADCTKPGYTAILNAPDGEEAAKDQRQDDAADEGTARVRGSLPNQYARHQAIVASRWCYRPMRPAIAERRGMPLCLGPPPQTHWAFSRG
jgi:hypothetical protein